MKTSIFIDPGVVTTGIVVMPTKYVRKQRLCVPLLAKSFTVPSGLNFHRQVDAMTTQVLAYTAGYLPECNFILWEEPKLFSGSALSHASTAEGHIMHMHYAAAWLMAHIDAISKHSVYIDNVRVDQWKGQMSKQLCHARARSVYERHGSSFASKLLNMMGSSKADHHWDALGLALWKMEFKEFGGDH